MKGQSLWESWEAQEPPPGFVDRVLDATDWSRSGAASTPSNPARTRALPLKTTMLIAAALVMVSLGALAALVQSSGRKKSTPGATATQSAPAGPQTPADSVPIAMPSESAPPPSGAALARRAGNRERREDVRTQLRTSLQAKGVEYDSHTGLPVPPGASRPAHNLSADYIRARIREDFIPLARSCYEAALVRLPALRGRLMMNFLIVGDPKIGGIVEQAEIDPSSDIDDREFKTCMRESLLSIVFEPPDNGGWVTVAYPFLFSPDDEVPGPDR